jgi:hypothetical protein
VRRVSPLPVKRKREDTLDALFANGLLEVELHMLTIQPRIENLLYSVDHYRNDQSSDRYQPQPQTQILSHPNLPGPRRCLLF